VCCLGLQGGQRAGRRVPRAGRAAPATAGESAAAAADGGHHCARAGGQGEGRGWGGGGAACAGLRAPEEACVGAGSPPCSADCRYHLSLPTPAPPLSISSAAGRQRQQPAGHHARPVLCVGEGQHAVGTAQGQHQAGAERHRWGGGGQGCCCGRSASASLGWRAAAGFSALLLLQASWWNTGRSPTEVPRPPLPAHVGTLALDTRPALAPPPRRVQATQCTSSPRRRRS